MDIYKTAVLGTSGAGKTLLLASLYNKLAIQKREVGFFLDAPQHQRALLADKYAQARDHGRPFPRGNQSKELQSYEFTCTVRSAGKAAVPVLKFMYLDYAGGDLTHAEAQEGSSSVQFLADEVKNAHALLVLLDGHKLLYHMRGENPGNLISFTHELDLLLPLVQESATASKPVHFVITKWDLLEGEHSLAQVRDKLLKHEDFRAIVEDRGLTPTRLVPVSALGSGFTRLNAEGHVEKVPGAEARPFMVEGCLGCLLFDLFQDTRQRIDRRMQNPLYICWRAVVMLIYQFGWMGVGALERALVPTSGIIGPTAGGIMYHVLTETVGQPRAGRGSLYPEAVIRQYEALEGVIRAQQRFLEDFERRFPDSRLTQF
jgi:hypothetical protein